MKNATSSHQISYIGWLFTFLLAPALVGQIPSVLAQGAEGPGFRQGGQAFRQGFQGRPSHHDRDNNPPGMRGGRGTNWENRPGPQGGAGAGPDFRDRQGKTERLDTNQDGQINQEDRQAARQQWLAEHPKLKERMDANHDGEIDQTERQDARRQWQQHRDRDNNPPGRRGGRGTNWENRPGPQGGPGTSPNQQAEPAASESATEPTVA